MAIFITTEQLQLWNHDSRQKVAVNFNPDQAWD